jgi:hypothetical protein
MRPSGRFFLEPNSVYKDRRAVHRANWLVNDVSADVDSALEPPVRRTEKSIKPFPPLRSKGPYSPEQQANWELVAGVAENHPRLLAWLAEGRVAWYWNEFGTMIAALRLVWGLRWLAWHYLFEPVARSAPWRVELYEAIFQKRRLDRNNELNKLWNEQDKPPIVLTMTSISGLSAVTDMATVTRTAARNVVRKKIEVMSSGCVGVSGFRGSGKSTLIHDICRHRYGTPEYEPGDTKLPGLRLIVQVPLLYDAREFLIHLYTCLCRAVLADVRLNTTSLLRHTVFAVFVPRSIRPATLMRGLSSIALLVAAGILAWRAAGDGWAASSWLRHDWEAIGAAVACLAGLSIIGWRTRQSLIEVRQIITLAADAQHRLEKLHFQRTDTRGGTGILGGPMGASLNFTGSRALTEQMMTLPELIDDYRDFAERVAAALQQSVAVGKNWQDIREDDIREDDIRLVIGIDQMDQIEDDNDARRFLKDLSSVFGTPRCVYLISVSAGTLATTNQHMVPLKTASGGIFDEMTWVNPFDLREAQDLLNRRVIGLPPAFIALCYVLSGGLPQDLLRIARAIFTTSDFTTSNPLELTEAAHNVISDEVMALKHRAMAHAASLDIPASPDLLRLLINEDWPVRYLNEHRQDTSLQPIEIETILSELSDMWAGRARQRFSGPQAALTAEICDSFLAGLYFLLTIYQLFTTEPYAIARLTVPASTADGDPAGNSALPNLARARTILSVNPYLAAALIRDTRRQLAEYTKRPDLFTDIGPHFLNPHSRTISSRASVQMSSRRVSKSNAVYRTRPSAQKKPPSQTGYK